MHDTDRILTETDYEGGAFEFGDETSLATETDMMSEMDEVDLASQFLEIQDEDELDQFLGGLIKRAKKIIRGPIGQAVVGQLKSAAKQYLPMARQAVERKFGAQAGSLFGQAQSALGLETDQEDLEFQMAKKFVRFANDAVQKAAAAPASAGVAAARNAVVEAARKHVPELLQKGARNGGSAGTKTQSGRWVRTERGILLVGA
jgi:hypothetical protein